MSEKYEKAAEKNDNTDAQQQSTIKKGVLYMKTTVTLLILFTLFSLNTFAQDSPQWHLPEGAKVRLGKGWINDIAYSPDGRTLASGTDDGTVLLWELTPSTTTDADTTVRVSPSSVPSPGVWGNNSHCPSPLQTERTSQAIR